MVVGTISASLADILGCTIQDTQDERPGIAIVAISSSYFHFPEGLHLGTWLILGISEYKHRKTP